MTTPADRLYANATSFSFFQAVRLLEQMQPDRLHVGGSGSPAAEIVRFRALPSLSFPPSPIYDLQQTAAGQPPEMTVTFFGLTGPSGILPRHYTELLLRLRRERKGAERTSLRDWFDLFNHRLISFFYRAWKKYRFYLEWDNRAHGEKEIDLFSHVLYSLIGMGTPNLRNRLRVSYWEPFEDKERVLNRLEDASLLFYAGLLSRQHMTASGLAGMFTDYLQFPVEVRQFQGQWLHLDESNQSAMGELSANNRLGRDSVAGERVWDVQGKIRVRLGPMSFEQFTEFIPDRSLDKNRKSLFVLLHFIRLAIGSELTFDVQLVLAATDIPECQLAEEDPGVMLGWNTWLRTQEGVNDSEDALFPGDELVWINDEHRPRVAI